MTYEELCASLGIDRPAITKALDVPTSTAVGKEQTYYRDNIGPRVKPPIAEDLSRFVSPLGQKVAGKLRKPKPKSTA